MKKKIDEIQNEMLAIKEQSAELSTLEILATGERVAELTSKSKVAVWRLFIYIIAVAHYVQRQLWDIFRNETEARVEATRPHTKKWYEGKARAFRLEQELIKGTDKYSDAGLTQQQIEDRQIIKHAAIEKIVINGYGLLRAKVAKENNGELVSLNNTELEALEKYFERVADAGSVVLPTSRPPDSLKLEIDFYYDPLVLNSYGQRLSGGQEQPAVVAIENYLKSLEFNGQLVLEKLEDYLKKHTDGALFPKIKRAWSKYGNLSYDYIGENAGLINEIRVADAGYMKLDKNNTTIKYIAYNAE